MRITGKALLSPVLLVGCWGRGFEYEGGLPQDTSAPVASVCGEDLDLTVGINVRGTAVDLETGLAIALPSTTTTTATALCVAAIDPSPAVVGQDPTYLVTSTLCDDGTFILAGLESIPTIGLMLGIYDCADEGTVMRTVTGVATEEFDGMGPGDTLEGKIAWSVSSTYLAAMQADLEPTTPDLAAEGFLSGFVVDSAGVSLDGATVGCNSCDTTPTYYLDADSSDGLWGAGATFNAATAANAGAYFIIPDAGITTYTCDDGGAHTWDGTLFGSLPGYGVFIQFDAI